LYAGSSSLFRSCHRRLAVGSLDFWELDSVLRTVTGVGLSKTIFGSRVRWILLWRWVKHLFLSLFHRILFCYASADMFYLLKHLPLLHLVNLTPCCNNLTSTLIMVLYASYVCFMHSRFIKNPRSILRRQTPHFWGGSATNDSRDIVRLYELSLPN
jgi:hypothetical protein